MNFYTTLYIIKASKSGKSDEALSCDENFLSVKRSPNTENDKTKIINEAETQNNDETVYDSKSDLNNCSITNDTMESSFEKPDLNTSLALFESCNEVNENGLG